MFSSKLLESSAFLKWVFLELTLGGDKRVSLLFGLLIPFSPDYLDVSLATSVPASKLGLRHGTVQDIRVGGDQGLEERLS